MRVVVLQEGTQPPLELLRRAEVAPAQEAPGQHAEPQLDLVQPRPVRGREVEHVLVRRVGQERPPLLARPQPPRLERDVAQGRDVLADLQAPVRVQVVQHPIEPPEVPEMRGHMTDVPAEVRTGPGRAEVPDHFAGGHRERGDQGPRAVADVLELALLRLAGLGRLRGVLALQDLHAGLLVAAEHQPPLLVQARGLQVQPADGPGLGVEVRVMAVEPVDALVGLDVGFRQDPPEGGPAQGPVVRFVDDGGGQVAEGPAGGGPVVRLGLAGGQVDDGEPVVGGKSPGADRSGGRPAGRRGRRRRSARATGRRCAGRSPAPRRSAGCWGGRGRQRAGGAGSGRPGLAGWSRRERGLGVAGGVRRGARLGNRRGVACAASVRLRGPEERRSPHPATPVTICPDTGDELLNQSSSPA